MKIRAISIVDLEIEGGFRDAANVEDALKTAIKQFCDGQKGVVSSQCEVRDRRGDTPPNLTQMKFRAN
tara:strand:+ start:140 stop:343 length:204 start_codon:yes stop_codon:yes gene_type:complete